MKVHKIRVRDRAASCDSPDLVQGTQGVDAVALDLDSEWSGLEVTVTFAAGSDTYTPAASDGLYPVPWELLREPGEIEVGIEGRNGTDVLRSVRMPWPLKVRPSLDGPGVQPSDPTVTDLQALVLEAKELRAQIAETVADARDVLGRIESYGIAEWGVDPETHRITVKPVRIRKDDAQ